MKPKANSSTLAAGFAMFSMFFGAGNVVFPLAIGQYAQDMNVYAILGLLLTGVGVPFLGLISMTLFNGNYEHFFERIGKVPGFLVITLIMIMIGPFGALPRLITVSHATFNVYFPGISLMVFSGVSCLLIFLLTFKKNKIVDILGVYLTPVLLFSLFAIIVLGYYYSPEAPLSYHDPSKVFFLGLKTGYETMDLLGAFFFSSVVLSCQESPTPDTDEKVNYRNIIFQALRASVIGSVLLSFVYIGFSSIASGFSGSLEGLERAELLGKLALIVLGQSAGVFAILAVALACLTTAIALAVVFSEFIHRDLLPEKVSYLPCLIVTLLATFYFSTMSFSGISAFLKPILEVTYPALIVLTLCNIAHKLWHMNIVKTPVAITFLFSLGYYVWT